MSPWSCSPRPLAFGAALFTLVSPSFAQELLSTLPRFERYEKLRREIGSSVKRGEVSVQWDESGNALYFSRDGKSFRFDIGTKAVAEGSPSARPSSSGRSGRRGFPERGRQFDSATSPDGKLKAFYRDRNVFVSAADGSGEKQITTDGSVSARIKSGIASWVYGEELGVREAMWWSPDGKLLAFYRFDESKVKDFHISTAQLDTYTKPDVEPYPKAGAENPQVELLVYDVAAGKTTKLDTKFDGGAGNGVAHYVYAVRWSPDGKELFFNRTNRKQNVMEFCAADPASGKCRVIIREQANTWTDNFPDLVWLDESRPGPKRFLWQSERNGFYNWYLYDLSGKLHNPVTKHASFEAGRVVKLDTAKGELFYMGQSGENPYLAQLHKAKLDGSLDVRLTDPRLSHTVNVSPDGRYFVDVAQTLDTPPVTRLVDAEGRILSTLGESDLSKFDELKLQRVERLVFRAADGLTVLYGTLHKPSDFDPARKYPVLVSVYGGPESGSGNERFATPSPLTELGVLVAEFDGRGTRLRGKAFKDAVYGKLGIGEIDDQAAGVKFLMTKPYVDASRIGIHGSSYGGYATAMALLRYPDLFHAGVAQSTVTDWRLYDSIYTERYMGLPWDNENKAGYDAGSCMTYAKNLKGKLLLFYGTADNNVHPQNTYQLVQALRQAGKRFSVLPGPDEGHSGLSMTTTLEFFAETLGIGG